MVDNLLINLYFFLTVYLRRLLMNLLHQIAILRPQNQTVALHLRQIILNILDPFSQTL